MERRVAIITGAASGIGKATVSRFAEDEAYKVVAVDKDRAVWDVAIGKQVRPVVADIADKNCVDKIVRDTLLEEGRIDILVNGAGVLNTGRDETYIGENGLLTSDYHLIREVNYVAPLRLMKSVLSYMEEQGGGRIINITSTKEHVPDRYHGPYAELKSKLTKTTLKMGDYFRERGIEITVLQPGNTKTNIDRGIWTADSDSQEADDVQALQDWWRNMFGNSPQNVADKIYQIAEGRIASRRVLTGTDAYLAYYLDKVPGWKKLFSVGYDAFLYLSKKGMLGHKDS